MIFLRFHFENYEIFLYNTTFIVFAKDAKVKGAVLWAAFCGFILGVQTVLS